MDKHQKQQLDVIVVGGGVGGSAAALRAAQYHLRTAWVTGDKQTRKSSRAQWVVNIDNMIGVHAGLLKGKFARVLKRAGFSEAKVALENAHFHIGTRDIVQNVRDRLADGFSDWVQVIDQRAVRAAQAEEGFAIELPGGESLTAGAVVVATGVMDRQPQVRKAVEGGEVEDDIRWVYPFANQETLLYCVRCEGHLVRAQPVCVIGHTESAAQVALALFERYDVPVRLLLNGQPLAATEETRRLLGAYGIGLEAGRIVDLVDERKNPKRRAPDGKALRGFRLESGEVVPARFGVVALGLYRVYNELARQLGAELEDAARPEELRHVLVDDFSETSVRGLFCVGDMAKGRGKGPSMKQIYTAQEYAVRAVDKVDVRRRKARRARVLAELDAEG